MKYNISITLSHQNCTHDKKKIRFISCCTPDASIFSSNGNFSLKSILYLQMAWWLSDQVINKHIFFKIVPIFNDAVRKRVNVYCTCPTVNICCLILVVLWHREVIWIKRRQVDFLWWDLGFKPGHKTKGIHIFQRHPCSQIPGMILQLL